MCCRPLRSLHFFSSGGGCVLNRMSFVVVLVVVEQGSYAIHVKGDNGADEIFCAFLTFTL